MPEKIDNTPQDEDIKEQAREFMSNMVGTTEEDNTASGADGTVVIKSLREAYEGSAKDDALLEKFWSTYDPSCTSIWTMKYDEADENESEEQTVEIVTSFLKEPGMADIKDKCFAVIHTLDSLEIEGLWFFAGSDPETLFGANPESSWYTFTQLGPQKMDSVKTEMTKLVTPADGKFEGKAIKNTQVF